MTVCQNRSPSLGYFYFERMKMTNPSVNCLPLDIISKDGKMIKYRPELRRVCKSVTSAILLQQIIFHWENKRKNPFYKFKDICSHSLYKTGDSWCEELGFSKKEFDRALKNIAYKEGKTGKVDKEGKALPFIPREFAFVIVYTDKDRITWYTINPKAVNLALNGIYYENDLWSSTIQNHQKVSTKINNQRGFSKDTKKTTKITSNIKSVCKEKFFPILYKIFYTKFLKEKKGIYYINYTERDADEKDMLRLLEGGYPEFSISDFYKLTEKAITVTQAYKEFPYTDTELAAWFESIRILILDKKIKLSRVDKILDWYSVEEHVKPRWTPDIHNGSDLVEKFSKVERAIIRYNKKHAKKAESVKSVSPSAYIMPKPEPEFSPVHTK